MRYERVREAGVILNQAVLIAIGVDWDGRRQVLAVELANRESRSSWREFLRELKARGLSGVEFVVADDHAGLRAALREELAEATYQRCCVHLLRNALDYVPRRVDARHAPPVGPDRRVLGPFLPSRAVASQCQRAGSGVIDGTSRTISEALHLNPIFAGVVCANADRQNAARATGAFATVAA